MCSPVLISDARLEVWEALGVRRCKAALRLLLYTGDQEDEPLPSAAPPPPSPNHTNVNTPSTHPYIHMILPLHSPTRMCLYAPNRPLSHLRGGELEGGDAMWRASSRCWTGRGLLWSASWCFYFVSFPGYYCISLAYVNILLIRGTLHLRPQYHCTH